MRSFIFTTGAAGAGSTHLSAGELKEMYYWTDPNSESGVLGIFFISGPEGRSKPFEKEKLCIKKNPVQRTFPDECSGQHYLVLKSKLWGFMGISKAAVIPQTLCITSCLTQGFYSPWNSLLLFNQLCSRRRGREGVIWFSRVSGDKQMQVQLSWNRDLYYSDGWFLYSRGGGWRKLGTVWRFSGGKKCCLNYHLCVIVSSVHHSRKTKFSASWKTLYDCVW